MAKKYPELLPLSGAIKQAKSARNGGFWNSYIPPPQVNFSNAQVEKLKRAELLSRYLSNNNIDMIVMEIQNKR